LCKADTLCYWDASSNEQNGIINDKNIFIFLEGIFY
jgi:hypothetical protein